MNKLLSINWIPIIVISLVVVVPFALLTSENPITLVNLFVLSCVMTPHLV